MRKRKETKATESENENGVCYRVTDIGDVQYRVRAWRIPKSDDVPAGEILRLPGEVEIMPVKLEALQVGGTRAVGRCRA